jgi:hypothetical protein
MASTLAAGELFELDGLVTPTPQGIASRVLARTAAGNITLFAFDAGEELSEHTAPFDALVLTLSGSLALRSADAASRPGRRRASRTLADAADHAAGRTGCQRTTSCIQ